MNQIPPSLIVVFDSNIWLKELGLRSSAGSAARFFLRKRNAELALPEVVKREVQTHLRDELTQLVRDIESNHRQLLAIFGSLKEMVLPTSQELEARAHELFTTLDVKCIEIPFTFESAALALDKAIAKVPPCDKTQEFKDAILWADCLSASRRAPVALVTADKAFYEDRSYEKGLSRNLSTEASRCPNRVTIYSSLSTLLSDLKVDVAIDEDSLERAALAAQRPNLEEFLLRNGFVLGARVEARHMLYATESASTLYLEYGLTFSCSDSRGEERSNATVSFSGSGKYDSDTQQYADLSIGGETLTFLDRDGALQSVSTVSGSMRVYLGHRTITHTTRFRL